MNHRRYTSILLILLGLLLGPVALVNFSVNPFRQFPVLALGAPDGQQLEVNSRRYKAAMVGRGGWEVLIVGNSIAEIGVNPQDVTFGSRKVFNAALPGGSMYETEHMVRVALASEPPPKRILLFVSLAQFAKLHKGRHDFDKSLLNPARRDGEHLVEGLLGWSTLSQSIKDKRFHKQPAEGEPPNFTPLGWRPRLVIGKNQLSSHELFTRRTRQQFTSGHLDAPHPEEIAHFDSILSQCLDASIQLDIIVVPCHVIALELFREKDNLADHGTMKRTIIESVTKVHGNDSSDACRVWDFSHAEEIITEPVPPAKSGPPTMRWWFEQDHITSATGNFMLEQLYTKEPQSSPYLLTQENVEDSILRTEAILQKARAEKPDLLSPYR